MKGTGFRSKFARIGAALLLGTVLVAAAACGGTGGSGSTTGNSGGSNGNPTGGKQIVLHVGFLAPTSGSVAASGTDMANGWKLWFDQHGTTYGNVKIDYKIYDSASDPNTALTKARQAVQQDGAQVLAGGLLASVGYAIAPYANQNKIPFLIPVSSGDDLSQRKAMDYVVKAGGWSSSQTTHVAGTWAYKQGYRNVVTLCNAYAFGYESCGGFVDTFTHAGGTVPDQLWAPLSTTDYSPYLSKIKADKPDAVFVEMVGATTMKFFQQWNSFGLKDSVPLFGQETTTDLSNIRKGDPNLFKGVITFGHWASGRDDPATQDFLKAFEKAYGYIPGYYAPGPYVTAEMLTEAVKQVKDPTDTAALIKAIRGVELKDSPFGPYKLDKYGGAVFNVYERQLVDAPADQQQYGKVWNKVLNTWTDVSQFGNVDPATYLKQPVYSDKFQGNANK